MPLALFDLDNTLLAGDSDFTWGEFIVAKGLVDKASYAAANLKFYEDYQAGTLDAYEYQRFSMAPLKGRTLSEMDALHKEFMADWIQPMMLEAAKELLDKHRIEGDRLVVITATNRFITQPIVQALGVEELLCSETGVENGVYTGELVGIPCMGEGKVTKITEWMAENNESLEGASFYSDSHNDLPLLKQVDKPVAVDPDEKLRLYAEMQGWPIISLR